jgi:hypothetical protein
MKRVILFATMALTLCSFAFAQDEAANVELRSRLRKPGWQSWTRATTARAGIGQRHFSSHT